MNWVWKGFNELSAAELYEVIRLRERVFVVALSCPYLDCDGRDQAAWHLLGYQQGTLVAYLRAFESKENNPAVASFGRVLTAPEVRGQGLGKELIRTGLRELKNRVGGKPIEIAAMAYLERFYSDFGFSRSGDEFAVEGIPHLSMVL